MSKRIFTFEFEDGAAADTGKRHDGIAFPTFSGNETLSWFDVNGVPYISGNAEGLVMLGKLLIQMGSCDYKDGFHFHLSKDFDCDKGDALIVGRSEKIVDSEGDAE